MILVKVFIGHKLSLLTILRARRSLGLVFRGSAYCQIIRYKFSFRYICSENVLYRRFDREGNKVKRFEWCQEHQQDNFSDVIWTDESSIQLETHRRTCSRKIGQPPSGGARVSGARGQIMIWHRPPPPPPPPPPASVQS